MEAPEKIIVENVEMAIGLQWSVPNEGTLHEIRQTAKRFSWSHGVSLSSPASCVGYANQKNCGFKLNGIPSAAACLALQLPAEKSAIVVEKIKLPKSRMGWWVLAIQEQVVYPDTDILLETEEHILNHLSGFREQAQFTLIGNAIDSLGVAQALQRPDEQDKTHGSVIPYLRASIQERALLRKCHLKKLAFHASTLPLLGAGLLLGAALVWDGMDSLATEDEIPIEELRSQAASRLGELRTAALHGSNAQSFNDRVRHALRTIPFYILTWKLFHIACDHAGCMLHWKTERGKLDHLAAAMDVQAEAFDNKEPGKTAALLLSYEELATAAEGDKIPAAKSTQSTALGSSAEMIDLCQHIRRFSASCRLEPATTVQLENAELLDPEMLFKQGSFKIRAPLSAAEAVSVWISEPWIKVQALHLNFTDYANLQWSLEGHYVIR
ncbi:MAG: hypothetical protein ACYYK0_03710 [Candidatus Eutrophobiaceae bacterium]